MRNLYGCIVAAVALLGAGPLHAQIIVAPVDPGPSVTDLIDDAMNHAMALEDNASLITGLAQAYLDVMQGFLPSKAQTTIAKVHFDAFGQRFTLGQNGFDSWGPDGPLDAGSYTTVESVPAHKEVSLKDLELWPFDLTQPGIPPIAYPASWPKPVEAYFYSATFGRSQPHVGLALRIIVQGRSQLVFVPMVEVPEGGLVSASDAAAYLGMLSVDGFTTTSFSDWALVQYVLGVTIGDAETHGEPQPGISALCDTESVSYFITTYYGWLVNILNTEDARHKAALDKLKKDFANGKSATLGGWIVGGATAGAIEGSFDPGLGPKDGAAVGCSAGALAGTNGWLFVFFNDATSIYAQINAETALHKSIVCTQLLHFQYNVSSVLSEFCPEMWAHVSAQMMIAMAYLGC